MKKILLLIFIVALSGCYTEHGNDYGVSPAQAFTMPSIENSIKLDSASNELVYEDSVYKLVIYEEMGKYSDANGEYHAMITIQYYIAKTDTFHIDTTFQFYGYYTYDKKEGK